MSAQQVNSGAVLITGSTGFVGRNLCDRLLSRRRRVRCAVRSQSPMMENAVVVGDIGPDTLWTEALSGVNTIIHLAARAHIMKDEVPDPLAEYRKVNVDGTLNLAGQAAGAGVSRFIFISSIKVNGEQTQTGKPFTAEDKPAPEDPYGISKYEAEQGLQLLAQETGMEVVIIRPPLVYGPGVKGNFASMTKIVGKGIPLPLGAVHNKRTLVALDNLIDLIITCVDHPAAANQVFLAGDGKDVSTTELLIGLAHAMDKPSRLIPVPDSLLTFGAALLGKKSVAKRLLGSLQVDISKTREVLGWEPSISVDEALEKTARDFLQKK